MARPMAEADTMLSPGMPNQGDTKLFIKFHLEAVQDFELSAKEGRPVHRDEEFITIIVPGDRDTVVRPVRPLDRQQYAQQYNAFKAGLEQPVVGTPLASLPFLTKAQVADFQAVNVRTVEQLAEMSDVLAQKFMGMHNIRKRAKDYLEAAAGAAPVERLNLELQKRDNELEALRKALSEQGKKLEELQKRK